ncbi:uncharacterized protein LOC117110928 [Anneissia japonica]|uniref:uncharacterized protein LOC117110928 n=1 Tax=Anneissia japonica TaxID=1529436 RepID=UPI001425615B|nr:uncharacterized protein LOC117110928 [Anneissia japonica]
MQEPKPVRKLLNSWKKIVEENDVYKRHVDHLLGLYTETEGIGEVEEWISEHHERMEQAFEEASKRTELNVLRRRVARDVKAEDVDLKIGTRVFLRKRNVKGRNKIQDVWDPIPHRVVKRLETGGHTYVVESLQGKPVCKTVHRGELLEAKDLLPDILHDPVVPEQNVTSAVKNTLQEDSDSDTDVEGYVRRTEVLSHDIVEAKS